MGLKSAAANQHILSVFFFNHFCFISKFVHATCIVFLYFMYDYVSIINKVVVVVVVVVVGADAV